MAFFGGSVGIIYRQFSVTIVSAMFLSVVVALVLTPALCATMLRLPRQTHDDAQHGFFGLFNRIMGQGHPRLPDRGGLPAAPDPAGDAALSCPRGRDDRAVPCSAYGLFAG